MSFGFRVTIPAGLTTEQTANLIGNTSVDGYTGSAALKLAGMVALAKRIVPHVIESGAVGNPATDEFVVDINGHVCEEFDYFGNNLGLNVSQKRSAPVAPPEPVNGRGWAAQQAVTGQQAAPDATEIPPSSDATASVESEADASFQSAPVDEEAREETSPATDEAGETPSPSSDGATKVVAEAETDGADVPPDAAAEIAAAAASGAPA